MLATCYSRDQLEGYLSGQLSDELSDQIELHVADCPTCEGTLTELDGASDTLIRTLRLKSGGAPEASPAWVEHVAERQLADDDSGIIAEGDGTPPSRLGDYELQRIIGRGGMSIVFAARHTHLGRDVALKVLLPAHQRHGVSRDRFAREMRAVGALDHPAIVRATDAGQFRNTSYLVMEKIDGVDLTRVSRRLGPLSVADACQIAVEAAQGLSYAHDNGVVHRDIKPSNLIVDDQGKLKILDFGLARIQSAVGEASLHTTVGQLLGTLDYMAPEQAGGSDVDSRADIYALGATLFKLLAGSAPHGRSADVPILEHLHRLATHPAPRLSDFRDDLPDPLVELVSCMLSKDPEQRVSSAQEAADRLAEFTDGANLQALRDQAYSPTDDDDDRQSAPSIRDNLNQIWPEEPEATHATPPKRTAPGKPPKWRGRTFWSCFVGALLVLAAMGFFGVVIILQTDQGEIRIESEIDDIRVGLVEDGRLVDTLVVAQGSNAIQIRSGKYEIRIDSPSDGVEVTPQQVVVKRSNRAIVKIQRTPTPEQTVDLGGRQSRQQDTSSLQLKLTETTSELAKARQNLGPDHPDVQSLVEQVTRLRALSRPIPSEPVYEGRTLSDWLAQMRFEQQANAKQYAAQSVAELSETRPGSEGLLLALEAGQILFRMRTENLPLQIDNVLFEILSSQLQPIGEQSRHALDLPVQRIMATDRMEADRILADMIAGDEITKRNYAMLLFARMSKRLADGNGEWTSTIQAMNTLVSDEDQLTGIRARTILAASVEDESEASRYLTEAESENASYMSLLCWFLVTRDRSLAIPRDHQVQWLGEYFTKIPDGDIDCLYSVFFDPIMGPLTGVNWDKVTDQQREDVSRALGPLIDELQEESKRLDRTPELELALSAKSYTLCEVIDRVSLDESTREAALAALNLRFEQLLDLRDRSDASVAERVLDSPSQVAVAITLLSGQTPAALKRPPSGSGPYVAELDRFSDPRTAFLPGSQGRNGQFEQLFAWYPYQVLKKFAEIETDRRSGSSSRSSISFLSLLERSHRTLVHPVLVVDHIAATPETGEEVVKWKAAFSQTMAKPRVLAPYVKRHPRFSERIVAWAEEARSAEMINATAGILRESWTQKQFADLLHDWLIGDELGHMSYAINELREVDLTRFSGEWRRDVARAIAELHAQRGGFLDLMEIRILCSLGDDAEPAIDKLAKSVLVTLEASRGQLDEDSVKAVELLARFPDKVQSMKPDIEAAIAKQMGTFETLEALAGLLKAIEQSSDSR